MNDPTDLLGGALAPPDTDPDVCPSCGLDDDHTPSCDRKPRIEAPELPEDAGELDELWQHLGDAIRALGALTPEHIDAMADELNYGELADLFLDAKAMADTIKAVEGRAKDLLLTEARRRFDEDGTATKWKRASGTVSLAVPDTPKPYVRDPGALIAWLEANGMDTLVDRDPRPDPKALDALAKSGTVTDTGIFVADGDGTPVDGVGCRPPGSPYLSRRSS